METSVGVWTLAAMCWAEHSLLESLLLPAGHMVLKDFATEGGYGLSPWRSHAQIDPKPVSRLARVRHQTFDHAAM